MRCLLVFLLLPCLVFSQPADTAFADLHALKAMIGDAEVVLLGEDRPGDSTSLRAKGRIVQMLAEQMGFNVLVFDAGIYDMHRAMRDIRSGVQTDIALQSALPAQWSRYREFYQGVAWLETLRQTGKPFELAGLQPFPGRKYTQENYIEDVKSILHRRLPATYAERFNDSILYTLDECMGNADSADFLSRKQEALLTEASGVLLLLDQAISQSEPERLHLQYLRRSVEEAIALAETPDWNGTWSPEIRRQLALQNLVYMDSLHPKAKIILWATNALADSLFADVHGAYPVPFPLQIQQTLCKEVVSIRFVPKRKAFPPPPAGVREIPYRLPRFRPASEEVHIRNYSEWGCMMKSLPMRLEILDTRTCLPIEGVAFCDSTSQCYPTTSPSPGIYEFLVPLEKADTPLIIRKKGYQRILVNLIELRSLSIIRLTPKKDR